ncbi:hypothetical protein GCM10029963_54380 [Micromonospora andamanensis]
MGGNQVGAARAVGIITLVVTAVLGTAYLLGRSLVPDPSRTDTAVTATGADHPEYADQSAPIDAEPDTSRSPDAGLDGSQGSDEHDQDPNIGPMGTRVSTGTAGVALTFDDGPHPDYTPRSSRSCGTTTSRPPSAWSARTLRRTRGWSSRSWPRAHAVQPQLGP